MPPQQILPKIYTLEQIEEIILSDAFEKNLISAIHDGFRAFSHGAFNLCPVQTLGAPPMAPFVADSSNYGAQTCVKSGYLTGDPYFVIKVASGGHPLPNSGLMQIYSQNTGRLEALLLDEGILTELRTAAAGAVAARLLAPKEISCIGMVGTGVQARYQLQLLKHVTDCRKVLVWGRTPSNIKSLSVDLERNGWHVTIAAEPNDVLERCSLVVTTTSSRQALLTLRHTFSRGRHITCIGADAPGKKELDTMLVTTADLLVTDSLLQTVERGEFQHAVAAARIDKTNILEIGAIVNRPDLQRGDNRDHRLTIFDSSGVAVQDCVIASMVYEALLAKEKPSDLESLEG